MLPAKDRHARDGIGPQLVEATGSIDHLRLWPIRMIAVAKANSNTFIRKMQQSIAMKRYLQKLLHSLEKSRER
jgi:hypothetical protein